MTRDRLVQQIGALIGALALIGQLLLPITHAQSWARANGNPLLYAFCGQISPALVEQLRRTALPDIRPGWSNKADHDTLAKLSCSLCGALHGGHLAGSTGLPPLSFTLAGSPARPTRLAPPPDVRLVVLPQLRGPPAFS